MADLEQNPCTSMIKYTPASERTLSLFRTPFEQSLWPDNRWVRMAQLVPWDDMAKVFFEHMSMDHGRASVDLRIVLGALLVKHIEGISDEDTIVYIQENIYAQYFVGLPSFQVKPVFSPTLFVEIRKRLGKSGAEQLNDHLLRQARSLRSIKHRAKPRPATDKNDNSDQSPPEDSNTEQVSRKDRAPAVPAAAVKPPNKGTLKVDATVAPQHIGYPTDSRLLHEARQYSEALIDELYQGHAKQLWSKKPRTYRRKARQQYLGFSKQRRHNKKAIRKVVGQQLRYLRRNLATINKMLDRLLEQGLQPLWQHHHWRRFWVLQEFYRQQALMFADRRKRVDNRIVNIAQPYVRPIKRGKAGADTEFGAKLNVSETEGFVRADRIDFEAFHEGLGLQKQIEAYKRLYGYYPECVLADRAYLTRANRKFLKDNGIRHSGKPLGRQPQMSRQDKDKRRKEQNKRAEIEGKFGQAKSKYGLDDIQTRRQDTSFACIGLILLALNVIKLAKKLYFSIFSSLKQTLDAITRSIWAFKFG